MIVVLGSINVDLVARVERLPRAGETLAGLAFTTSPGGKGANQALAARRAGAEVSLFGAVGHDAFAASALELLRDDGVNVVVRTVADTPTGVAVIHVDARGENAITIVAGANAHVRSEDVPGALLGPTTIVLLQLETPQAQALALARRARALGARVVLNAAPATQVDAGWRDAVDVLVVNAAECEAVAAAFGEDTAPERFVRALAAGPAVLACVTLGAKGAVAAEGERFYRVPALAVEVVDTVAAGDAFVGVLAAALAQGAPTARALARAAAAGALACTRDGAQPSLPRAADIATHAATLESRIEISPLRR
ncbi:MAG: ribokinase [Gammaproteobacteria bacterium]|nr:ribokinase [Gammaproteobacteria bacterium]